MKSSWKVSRKEYRYYLEASEPVVIAGQRYHPGELIRTAKGRLRSFATLERAIAWKHAHLGLNGFPVKPTMLQASLPKLKRR